MVESKGKYRPLGHFKKGQSKWTKLFTKLKIKDTENRSIVLKKNSLRRGYGNKHGEKRIQKKL